MKKIDNQQMTQIIGGDVLKMVCSGLSVGRGAIGVFNLLVAEGIIAGTALATGGTAIAVVALACGVYSLGGGLDWW